MGPNGSSRTAHYDASTARRCAISRSDVETSAKTLAQSPAAAIRALITPRLISIAESDRDADRLLEVLRPLKQLRPPETEKAFQAHAVLLRVIRQALSECGVADECFLRVLNHLADYLLSYDLMYDRGRWAVPPHFRDPPQLVPAG